MNFLPTREASNDEEMIFCSEIARLVQKTCLMTVKNRVLTCPKNRLIYRSRNISNYMMTVKNRRHIREKTLVSLLKMTLKLDF